jgi:prophage endopeptidase
MNLTALVPLPYRILALALFAAALVAFGYVKGLSHEHAKWDAANVAKTIADDKAILARVDSNTKLAIKQAGFNEAITKAKHEELDPIVAAINADRMRVGPAICSGLAAPAEATSTSGGNAADTGGRVLPPDLERDLKALEIRVEEALATGRACQAFVRVNGMAQ